MSMWQNPGTSTDQTSSSSTGAPQTSSIKSFVNAVYYPNGTVYRGQTPRTLNPGFISHIIYAFAWPDENGTVSLSDTHVDLVMHVDGQRGCIMALSHLKRTYPYLKILLSIGGRGRGSEHFRAATETVHTRHNLAKSAKVLIDSYGFDGIDIFWRYPNTADEGQQYLSLLKILRELMPGPRYILTTALPAGLYILQHIPLAASAEQVDFINLMAYDFYGSWSQESGHQAQLFVPEGSTENSGQKIVSFLADCGVPVKKILLGIPAYGRSFLGASGPGDNFTGQGGDNGIFEYSNLPARNAAESMDGARCAAWCHGGEGGWISYDNAETVKLKASWVRQMGLGGMFYWTGTSDVPGPRSLVEAGYKELHEQ